MRWCAGIWIALSRRLADDVASRTRCFIQDHAYGHVSIDGQIGIVWNLHQLAGGETHRRQSIHDARSQRRWRGVCVDRGSHGVMPVNGPINPIGHVPAAVRHDSRVGIQPHNQLRHDGHRGIGDGRRQRQVIDARRHQRVVLIGQPRGLQDDPVVECPHCRAHNRGVPRAARNGIIGQGSCGGGIHRLGEVNRHLVAAEILGGGQNRGRNGVVNESHFGQTDIIGCRVPIGDNINANIARGKTQIACNGLAKGAESVRRLVESVIC